MLPVDGKIGNTLKSWIAHDGAPSLLRRKNVKSRSIRNEGPDVARDCRMRSETVHETGQTPEERQNVFALDSTDLYSLKSGWNEFEIHGASAKL
jgi:hypothetical protein